MTKTLDKRWLFNISQIKKRKFKRKKKIFPILSIILLGLSYSLIPVSKMVQPVYSTEITTEDFIESVHIPANESICQESSELDMEPELINEIIIYPPPKTSSIFSSMFSIVKQPPVERKENLRSFLYISKPEIIMQHTELDPAQPMIALTFDDGPSIHTETLLNLLEQYNARATFFVLGSKAGDRKEILQRAAQLGCDIAGHSWNHKNMTSLNKNEIKRQITDTHTLIESIVGEVPHLHRLPYGSINEKVRAASEEVGFALVKWSVDPRDWEKRDADAVANYIMENVRDGGIIVCHDIYESTITAMKQVIPQLIAQGYQLVTVSELLFHLEGEIKPGVEYLGRK